jgi:hypothetical protein
MMMIIIAVKIFWCLFYTHLSLLTGCIDHITLLIMSELELERVSQKEEASLQDEEDGKEENNDQVVPRETLMALSIAYLSVFIDILGVSIILPIIPFLAIDLMQVHSKLASFMQDMLVRRCCQCQFQGFYRIALGAGL